MSNFTLGVICAAPRDATSFYRVYGPLGSLRNLMPEMTLQLMTEINWTSIKQVDAVLMQRPYLSDHIKMAEMIKKNGKPLILDFDDDLTCVPLDNPNFMTYQGIEKNVADLVAMADKVIVSTEELKNRFMVGKTNKFWVIPNALDDIFLPLRLKHESKTSPTLCWRGSETHLRDVAEVSGGLVNALQTFPNAKEWVVEFWGCCPYFIPPALNGRIKNFLFHGPTDIMDYHADLVNSQPRIAIVPLSDSKFNKAKSHCAWLEFALAGAVVIAPDWPEWKHQGIINYKNPALFGDALSQALAMSPKQCENMNERAWKEIRAKYMLSDVNKMRESLLKSIL